MNADALASTPLMLPVNGSELFAAYVQRTIIEDPLFMECTRKLEAASPLFESPIRVPLAFAPVRFMLADILAGHAGLDRVTITTMSDRTTNLLNTNWYGRSVLSKSLDVRMAALALPDLGANRPSPLPIDPRETAQITLCRQAARQRDVMVARLCDALRNGTVVAHGFAAMDIRRQIEPIQAGWWEDPALTCFWEQRELRPIESAAPGTPHFRGLVLSVGTIRPEANGSAPTDRTGAPGAPSSMHLIELEMRRRHAAGEMITRSVQSEAKELEMWFPAKYPDLRPAKAKTIQNQLASLHRQLKASQN